MMVELGAGFGKWGLEAVFLGRRMHVRVRAVLVEADPMHLSYIREAVREAGVPSEQVMCQGHGGQVWSGRAAGVVVVC